ncbi:TonB-dependent receptor [Bacteroides pyogenes JCM 10003]|nr:TonB-dependent receptor [Bacteroides pyogenes JCM 10003]
MRDVAAVDYLKLRVSYGRSGFDFYDYAQDRQYWVGSGSYHFQDGNTTAGLSLKEGVLAMNKLDLEVADKYNIGVDMSLFKGLSLSVDGFYDRRSNILIDGSGLISSAIGVQVPNMNAGRVDTKGVDGSVMWKKQHKDFQYYTGVNFSYVRSNVKENGEGYQPILICRQKAIRWDRCSVGKLSDISGMKRISKTVPCRDSRKSVRAM